MTVGGEVVALALSAGFVVAAIYAFDWVDRQWCRMIDEHLRIEAQPWGEVVEVPLEARLPSKRRGERPRGPGAGGQTTQQHLGSVRTSERGAV